MWRLELAERVIKVCNFTTFQKYMELDGIGFLLEYDKETEAKIEDPDFIRRHLVTVRNTFTYVEADTNVL